MKASFQARQKKRRRTTRIILLVFSLLLLVAALAGYWLFQTVMRPIVRTPDQQAFHLYIPSQADYQQVGLALCTRPDRQPQPL